MRRRGERKEAATFWHPGNEGGTFRLGPAAPKLWNRSSTQVLRIERWHVGRSWGWVTATTPRAGMPAVLVAGLREGQRERHAEATIPGAARR